MRAERRALSIVARPAVPEDDLRPYLADLVHADQRHRGLELATNEADRLGDPLLAERAEAVDIGPADHAGLGAERNRTHHVLPGTHAAVEQHLDPAADR